MGCWADDSNSPRLASTSFGFCFYYVTKKKKKKSITIPHPNNIYSKLILLVIFICTYLCITMSESISVLVPIPATLHL